MAENFTALSPILHFVRFQRLQRASQGARPRHGKVLVPPGFRLWAFEYAASFSFSVFLRRPISQ